MRIMSYLDFLNTNYSMRRTAEQKEAFRAYILSVFPDAKIETTADGKNQNVVIGDPLTAKMVCTAHYDTPASSLFPNLMIPRNPALFLLYQFVPVILMLAVALGAGYLVANQFAQPGEQNFLRLFLLVYLAVYYILFFLMYRVFKNPNNYNDNTSGVAAVLSIIERLNEQERAETAFILFDNEEKGLLGSSLFKKLHGKKMKNTLVINFDCVSDGDYIQFYPNKVLKKNDVALTQLETSFQPTGTKHVEVVKGFGFYPSDQKAFVNGVGVAAMHKSWFGYWLGRIHTNRDTVFDEENIELLRLGALKLASTFSKL